jgi:amino-acid N-acetyltransferase
VSKVETAAPADLCSIRALLEASGLPTSDLVSASPQFIVIRHAGRIVAAGALECYGSAALLRSLVVAADQRARGLGGQLTRELEHLAQSCGISQLILLTVTAGDFFERRGYRVIERSAAPAAVHHSAEFRSLCPGSAKCMAKVLGPPS